MKFGMTCEQLKNCFESANKKESSQHSHYKKDASHLKTIDVYRVLTLFDVTDPCQQHAVKKILCAGIRGDKSRAQDMREAIDSLNRSLEMMQEDIDK